MKILLATDGSEHAKQAAEFVLQWQMPSEAELTVLTVTYDPKEVSHGNVQPWFAEWNKHEKEMVQSHHQQLATMFQDHFSKVTVMHRTGNATQTILDVASSTGSDLIVMGAVGHSLISRMLLGSISDNVATGAECSVLIVRPADVKQQQASTTAPRITLAYDDSAQSREAIAELLELKWEETPNIDVVTIAPQYDYFMGDGMSPMVLENEQQIFESMRQSSEQASEQIAKSLPQSQAHTIRGNHVGESIIQHASDQKSNLIVIGDRSHGALHDLLLGSTTKYVLRHAPCSVWISRHHTASETR